MPYNEAMRKVWTLGLLMAACGPPPSAVTTAISTATPLVTPPPSAVDHAALARAATADGVLDIAAEHARLAWEANKTDGNKHALGVALVDAWAFEKARAILGDDASIPKGDLTPTEPDGERVGRALRALAAGDWKSAEAELAPLAVPRASPLVLELLGRAHLGRGDRVEARKLWSRARSRIDATGAKIGLLPMAPEAINDLRWDGGILTASRARDRYLVGGYQSSRTHTEFVERYAPGDPVPLLRWAIGNPGGYAPSSTSVTLVDRPLDGLIAPVPETARVFDMHTGFESAHWPVTDIRFLFASTSGVVFAGTDKSVQAWDAAGAVTRTFAITGSTPGVIRAYRTNGQHDTIPTTYPTAPLVMTVSAKGVVVVGASDGTIWVWPPTPAASFQLKEGGPPPADEQDASNRRPLAMRIDDAAQTVLVATGGGAVVSWDLKQRKKRIVVEARCTEKEFDGDLHGQMSPEALAACARSSKAAFNLDGSRVMLAGMMGGPRVRDARTGAGIGVLDTLASDATAFVDSEKAWLGGVDGTITEWNTTSGERITQLAQGGVGGFAQSISSDGRYIAVMEPGDGFHTQLPRPLRVWDTTTRRAITLPADITQMHFAERGVIVASTRDHTFLWDMGTSKRGAELGGKDEHSYVVSSTRDRIVSERGAKIVVRDSTKVLREIDMGAQPWAFAVDRDARTAAILSDASEVIAWNLEDGHELMRRATQRGSSLAISPEGHSIAVPTANGEVSVMALDDGRELGHIASKDLSVEHAYMPTRVVGFASETEALVIGPGAPGFERIYKWTVGGKAEPTELQVLMTNRIDVWSTGVAAVFDRNDSINLLRIRDGVLLASIYATRGGGYIAMSREGAVDGPPEGSSAAITFFEGPQPRTAMSSWLAWDRFAVGGLLTRATKGELVAPLIPGYLALTDTLSKHAH